MVRPSVECGCCREDTIMNHSHPAANPHWLAMKLVYFPSDCERHLLANPCLQSLLHSSGIGNVPNHCTLGVLLQ